MSCPLFCLVVLVKLGLSACFFEVSKVKRGIDRRCRLKRLLVQDGRLYFRLMLCLTGGRDGGT